MTSTQRLPSAERKGEVVRTAMRLFYERGYRRTTMQDIADEIGFTKAAVYYYFKSKESLLVYAYINTIDEGIRLAKIAAAAPKSPRERFLDLLVLLMERLVQNRSTIALVELERESVSKESLAEMRSHQSEYLSILRGVYTEGVEAGEFEGDPDVAIPILLAACSGIHRLVRPDDDGGGDDAVVKAVALLLAGGYERKDQVG